MRKFLSDLIQDLSSLPKASVVIIVGNFINRLGHFVMPFLALYLSRKGYSFTDSGLALATHGAGLLIAAFLGGYFADSIGRKNTILISLIGNGVSILALGCMDHLSGILICSGLVGLTSGMYPPAANALIADLVPESQRSTAYASVRLAVNAGFACGAAMAGFLMKGPLWVLFVGDALTSLVYAVIVAALLPSLGAHRQTSASIFKLVYDWKITFVDVARNPAYLRLLFSLLPIILVFMQIFSTLGVSIKKMGLDESYFGLLLAFNGGLIITLEIIITRLVKPIRKLWVMALGFLLIGAGAAGFAWSETMSHLLLCIGILTFGEMLAFPTAMAYSAKLAPEKMRGRYMGLGTVNWSIGSLVAPLVGLWLLETFGSVSWVACGVLGIIAATVILWPLPFAYPYSKIQSPLFSNFIRFTPGEKRSFRFRCVS
ncbi:MAG: MFS transporter [Verrucomicrobiota bacterium]